MISSRKALLAAFGTLAIILLCTTWVTRQNTLRLKEDTDLVLRSHQVSGAVQEAFLALADAESAKRAYLATGDPAKRQDFQAASMEIPKTVQRLNGLVQDRPEQRARALELGKGLAARVVWLDRVLPGQAGAPGAQFLAIPDALRAQAGTLIREEKLRPALLIGVPVGFVSAAESKEAVLQLDDVPYIVARGRKGGSPLAVAIIHALLLLAAEGTR